MWVMLVVLLGGNIIHLEFDTRDQCILKMDSYSEKNVKIGVCVSAEELEHMVNGHQ